MKRDSLAEQGHLLSNAQTGGGWGISNPSEITSVIGPTPIVDTEGSQARRVSGVF